MHISNVPLTGLFTISVLISSTSALPLLTPLDNTPVGLGGAFTEINTEPILPQTQHSSRPNLGSKFREPILPREQNADNVHIEKTGLWTESSEDIPRLPRDVGKDDTADIWVEAQFDPRAEVTDGRGAKKGKWRSAANQFLPW